MVRQLTDILDPITGITGIYSEQIELRESFLDTAARFVGTPGTVVLMSGGDLDCARYHILAAKPWLSFTGRRHQISISSEIGTTTVQADPFDVLRSILSNFRIDTPEVPAPVVAGLFGYLAYDLKDCLEVLPRTSVDTLGLPHVCLYAPSIILIHDKVDDTTRLFIPERPPSVRSRQFGESKQAGRSTRDEDLEEFHGILDAPPNPPGEFRGSGDGFKSNLSRSNYLKSVERILEYIADGDVYQVNMSQRFDMDFTGDSFSLFRALYTMNPAPFFSYIQAGDHQIVSTSPERFICRSGNRVETRPIKGTRPRGKTPDEDRKLRRELKESKKDDAELSMIVDLLRNDIGKVCEGGSVQVAEHKRLEAYQNVYHLVSIVEGTLQKGKDTVALIKATFPGGSITGCPKIRTMEIIDELEPNRRHIYTGSIGYLSFHDTTDLSIAIRTATITNGKIVFSVGGGIVFDSDPLDEFEETLHKGQTLMSVFGGKAQPSAAKNAVWLNGILEPIDEARIPITDQGVQYGFGFFETLRVEQGEPRYLADHLERFNNTWQHLFEDTPPDITWHEVINQVLTHNSLKEDIAAVKIIATRGDRDAPPYRPSLMVTSRPYVHRLTGKKAPGMHLGLYPEPRRTPLANHKTLNYLYYLLAGKWANSRGMDEAIILNPDGTVSETNTANILLIRDQTVIRPKSPHVLPGIMEKIVSDLLCEWGYATENSAVRSEDLFRMDQVVITNSLIGAIPVSAIDGKEISSPGNLWQRINDRVLG